MCIGDRAADDRQSGIWSLSCQFATNQRVKPARCNSVLLESFQLQELDEILHCCPEVTMDAELLEGNDHVLPALSAVLAVCEYMPELRVCEFVHTTSGADGEIAPDICARTEVQFLQRTRRRLETCVGILRSDPDGHDVSLGPRFTLEGIGLSIGQ